MSKKLYKALESIALGYSEGSVSVDVLIKACDNYKLKTDFEDDFDYQIIVAKSCFDYLNGVEPDKELNKAIADIQKKMKKAAAELNFEAAAEYRDRLIMLKNTLRDL